MSREHPFAVGARVSQESASACAAVRMTCGSLPSRGALRSRSMAALSGAAGESSAMPRRWCFALELRARHADAAPGAPVDGQDAPAHRAVEVVRELVERVVRRQRGRSPHGFRTRRVICWRRRRRSGLVPSLRARVRALADLKCEKTRTSRRRRASLSRISLSAISPAPCTTPSMSAIMTTAEHGRCGRRTPRRRARPPRGTRRGTPPRRMASSVRAYFARREDLLAVRVGIALGGSCGPRR